MRSLNRLPVQSGCGIFAKTSAVTLPTTYSRKYYWHYVKSRNRNCRPLYRFNFIAYASQSDCTMATANRSSTAILDGYQKACQITSLMTANHTRKMNTMPGYQRQKLRSGNLTESHSSTNGRGGMFVFYGRSIANITTWPRYIRSQAYHAGRSAK